MVMEQNRRLPEFWGGIPIDSIISLQVIGDLAGDYEIDCIWELQQVDGLCKWWVYTLSNPKHARVWLVTRTVDQEVSLVVYLDCAGFLPGNRKDVIDRGDDWLFSPPKDPGSFCYNDLEYIGVIGGPGMDYFKKAFGDLQADCRFPPEGDFGKRYAATVVEYVRGGEEPHPELMVLEVGDPESGCGGLIYLLEGEAISLLEVDVLRR